MRPRSKSALSMASALLVGVVSAQFILAFAGLGPEPPEDLAVTSLSLVAPDGSVRAKLVTTDDGARLDLFDNHGRPRATILTAREFSTFALANDGRIPTARVVAIDSTGPMLALTDKTSGARTALMPGRTQIKKGRGKGR